MMSGASIRRAIFVAGTLVAILACGATLAGQPYVAVEQRLSADQMRATGLDQLRPEQLSLLNELLREQQDNVAAEVVTAERDRRKREATETVTSTLKGEFQGWKDGTVLELANGQRWRVVGSEYYTPQRIPNAKVTIAPGAFGSWFVRVDGVNAGAKVKRIEP
jgi:hypothetical protein